MSRKRVLQWGSITFHQNPPPATRLAWQGHGDDVSSAGRAGCDVELLIIFARGQSVALFLCVCVWGGYVYGCLAARDQRQ